MRARRGRGEGSVSRYTQKRKDGTTFQCWRASVIINKGPNGYGKRKSVYAGTKEEVLAKIQALKQADRDGIEFDKDKIRFGAYAKMWLEHVIKPNRENNTHRQYESILTQHLLKAFGNLRLRDIKPPMIRDMLSQLERDGKSPRLRQIARTILSAIMRQAVEDQYLSRNPVDAVKPVKLPKKEMQTLSPAQVNALLAAARGDRFEALYHLAVMTGARQGEIFALRWCDIDLDSAIMTIQRSLEDVNGKLEPKSTKSNKVRRVNLTDATVALLRDYKAQTSPKVLTMRRGHRDEELVFFTTDRNKRRVALRKSNFLRNRFQPMLKRAGIDEHFHFHGLRHTCASLMLANGESVKVVAEKLGHDPAMTLRVYAHVLPGVQREAESRLESMLASAK